MMMKKFEFLSDVFSKWPEPETPVIFFITADDYRERDGQIQICRIISEIQQQDIPAWP